MAIPKFYYHITQKKWPKRLTLIPKNRGSNRSPEEPKVSRICVSTNIEGCLLALGCCLTWKGIDEPEIYIYRTVKKVIAENSYDVIDSCVTKEKWITKPTRFIKVGFINYKLPASIFDLSTGDWNRVTTQYKLLEMLKDRKQNFVTWTR